LPGKPGTGAWWAGINRLDRGSPFAIRLIAIRYWFQALVALENSGVVLRSSSCCAHKESLLRYPANVTNA
jgi:hypothetical protein